jgi:CheY-like chemotaxis protein
MIIKQPVILVVDDDPNDQFLFKSAFKKNGVDCHVYAVGDGAEAIAYLKGEGVYADRSKFLYPTLLTIDLKMPRVNGFELLAFLKQNPNFMVVPTIVFTSSNDRNDIVNAFLLGANAYHVKPADFEDLCAQLKIVHDYWATCEVPEIDPAGNLVPTVERGKLSENIPRPLLRERKLQDE